jgi:hypothetical protein
MATLGTTAAVAYLGLRGDGKEKTTPPIQASSGDEEKFIKYVSPSSNIPYPHSATVQRRYVGGG